jgi:hypothetical protein
MVRVSAGIRSLFDVGWCKFAWRLMWSPNGFDPEIPVEN